ncbi:MAG: tetratricopeptide repeat protein [candidate division Zixibacteria bacterium]|nr:tetratricopeptide repeat protein [candidate division Zixibacteria bacterium]
MVEYGVVFFVLLGTSLAFYLVYKRFLSKPTKSVSVLYVEALKDLLNDEQVQAFTKLRQVVAEETSNIDAYLRLGQILRENGKPDRALQVHKDLTLRTHLPSDDKKAILRQLAEDYFALRDLDTAEAALKELLALAPDDRWVHEELLKIQEAANKWDEAYDTAAALLKIEGEKSRKRLAVYKYRMGYDLYQKLEHHKARILFKEAIGLDPTYVQAFLAVGDSYRDEERFEDAVNFWKKLIGVVPDQGHKVIERLKKTLFDLGRYGELSDVCDSILSHDPRNLEARLTLAEFSEKKGDVDTARSMLEQIVEDHPGHLKSVVELIRVYLGRNDNRRLDELFRTIARRGEDTVIPDSGEAASSASIRQPAEQ